LPNYGNNERPQDVVPDWLLGGNRKRVLLRALAESTDGQTVAGFAKTLKCGRTTAFETVMALRDLGVIAQDEQDRVKLDDSHPLTGAIKKMLEALAPFADQLVDRPRRSRGRT
jgi:DNA-binding IclR family transcriptional regulator